MSRLALLLALALALCLTGCADRTPCEADVDCVILCTCANGATASGSGFTCRAGGCGDGHVQARDCVDICSRVGSVPGGTSDDDDSGPNDDDSGNGR